MKRTLTLLTVMAIMVVMLAMSVAPAFAAGVWDPNTGCKVGDGNTVGVTGTREAKADHNGDNFVCRDDGGKQRFYDNRT